MHNLKIAFRALLRHRNFTIINIAGLSLGMAAAIFAFLWVQNEFSYDRFHQKANNIYRINTDNPISNGDTWYWATTPLPLKEVIINEVPEAVQVATMTADLWASLTLKNNATQLSSKKYTYVSEDWFDLFDYKFISGSAAGFSNNLRSVILTRDFAEKLFGNWDVAGEIFELDTAQFVVHAVIENHPLNSGFQHEIIIPIKYYLSDPENNDDEHWGNFNYVTFVELWLETDLNAINNKLTALANKYRQDNDIKLTAQPLSEIHFDEQRSFGSMTTGSRQTTYTFAIIGLIILFLACVNYVSLTTAQAGMRTKEVGVRKIIGAKGSHIFRLVFTESLLTTFFALLLGLCVVQIVMPFFNNFTEKHFQLDPTNPAVWLVTGGTLITALLLSGIYPAFFLTGFSPGHFLKGQQFLKIKNTHFRKGLVVVQFAMTVSLIIGAMVILQQQDFIRQKDLGFDRSQVFEVQVPYSEQRPAIVKAMRQEMETSPSIVGTAVTNSSIIDFEGTHSGSLDWNGKPEDFVPTVSPISVDPSYLDVLQLTLLDGRWFQHGNEADLNNVVLNETAIRQFQLPEPIVGQTFHFRGREGQVIGLVEDFHYQDLRKEIGPVVLFHRPQSQGKIIIKTSEGQAANALAAAENAWGKHLPNKPFAYSFMDESLTQLYKNEAKNAGLFKVLAGLAIFISCLGLFGLAVFSTQQRTKEIGVRKVLGASVVGLVGLLSKDFIKLVVIALAVAAPIAFYFMELWLREFAYRIAISWWVFALAGLLAIGVAFLTVSFQSVKAALANPVESLRTE